MIYQVEGRVIPEGTHIGKLIGIDEKEGKYGPILRFAFYLDDYDDIVYGVCGAKKVARGTRLYDWLQTLSGSNLDAGQKIDLESLIESVAEIKITNVEREGRIYHNVTELLRLIIPAQGVGDTGTPAAE